MILATGGVFIERIVSLGHGALDDFWYDLQQNEWVLLVTGAVRLRLADPDELIEMEPGLFINIPARRRHRVEWTDPSKPTLWLAVHY